jgi:hypothetical protein
MNLSLDHRADRRSAVSSRHRGEQVERAFAQIEHELRSQYVLTYYTDRRPEEGIAPVVGVARRGMKVKSALPLDLAN